jgi:hypothetical protein
LPDNCTYSDDTGMTQFTLPGTVSGEMVECTSGDVDCNWQTSSCTISTHD